MVCIDRVVGAWGDCSQGNCWKGTVGTVGGEVCIESGIGREGSKGSIVSWDGFVKQCV